MDTSPAVHLTVVSDYICPWCFIGLTRVERLERDYERLEVEWAPYELRPNTPPQGIPFDRLRGSGRYSDEYLRNVSVIAGHAGIQMADRKLVPNSLPSLKAAEWAREIGVFTQLHRALFGAYFEDGLDIGSMSVLAAIANSLGLDADDLIASIEEGRYDARLQEKLEWSRVAGQGGIPRFIFKATYPDGGVKRFGFAGAQDYELFQRVMDKFGAAPRAVRS